MQVGAVPENAVALRTLNKMLMNLINIIRDDIFYRFFRNRQQGLIAFYAAGPAGFRDQSRAEFFREPGKLGLDSVIWDPYSGIIPPGKTPAPG